MMYDYLPSVPDLDPGPGPDVAPSRPLRFGLGQLFVLLTGVAIVLAIWQLPEPQYFVLAILGFVLEVAIGLYWYFHSAGVAVVWLFVCWGLTAPLTPMCSLTGDVARRVYCQHNMQQLMRGLHEYYDVHGHLPPAYTVDAQGQPLHSWRVLILPYIGEEALYQEFRLDEPWNSPHNLPLAQKMPDLFRCPSSQPGLTTFTNYVAPVGPQSIWPEERSTRLRDIKDSKSLTIALLEWPESNIVWTQPRDLPADNLTPLTHPVWKDFRDRHRPVRKGEVMVGFVSGGESFVPLPKLSPLTLRADLACWGRSYQRRRSAS